MNRAVTDLLDDDTLLDLRRRAKATDPAAVLAEERARRAGMARHQGDIVPAATPAPATAPGICATCQQRPARDACTACGKPTCAADLWIMLRLCRSCASDADVARGQRGARPEGSNWLAGGGRR